MAVSIKTFVLSLSASFGMLLILPRPAEVWRDQDKNCDSDYIKDQWWRILLYLACSASALGQYRFRLVEYWRGLAVQLVAYEVQFQVTQYFVFRSQSAQDNTDTMAANIFGAASAVVVACFLAYIVDFTQRTYYSQLLQRAEHREDTPSPVDDLMYDFVAGTVRFFRLIRIGRRSELDKLVLEQKLKKQTDELRDPSHLRDEVKLDRKEEDLLLDTLVNAESINVWAMLMPAVYQLVPGSMLAKLWFNIIFPPQPEDTGANNIFAELMVVATSLALGLIIGFAFVQCFEQIMLSLPWSKRDNGKKRRNNLHRMGMGMYTMAKDNNDDPGDKTKEKMSAIEEEPPAEEDDP
mmetsp:Transcript_46873/g.141996  ORF Transcript_46873/g.141996 Transcript_46873/m.141996 type:complete len:350 (-) Transcript_46873:113-1162(-)